MNRKLKKMLQIKSILRRKTNIKVIDKKYFQKWVHQIILHLKYILKFK